MKLFAALLITASLVAGLIASVTAYVPKLDMIDAEDELTLNAAAGVAETQPHRIADPVAPRRPRVRPTPGKDLVIDAELLESLRADGETRVRVKEFSWSRWQHLWLFVLATIGLFTGAMLLRRASAKSLAQQTKDDRKSEAAPATLLKTALDRVRQLQREIATMHNVDARAERIIHTLDELHEQAFEPFVAARPALVNQYGMSGYAQIMDRFAAAERQLNRAWSAAADRVLNEAELCIEQALQPLEDALARLG